MQFYFFTGGLQSSELSELELRLKNAFPTLQKLATSDEFTDRLGQRNVGATAELVYVIIPMLAANLDLDRMVSIAAQDRRGTFLIFVSREISGSDYKRLVRAGGADWASLQRAPEEILDIISRTSGRPVSSSTTARPTIVSLVPSCGGAGNATIAVETAVQIKTARRTRDRRLCILDLDTQASHVCDYLDIEPRLQIKEIADNPDRLDAQLFDLFVSHHPSTGVDVLASPRSRTAGVGINIGGLDALFRMISQRYDVLIVDLPPLWFEWTGQVLSVCDLAVVTGLNHVPGLRQAADTLQAVKTAEPSPHRTVVVLNRCETSFLGRIARRGHVSRLLGQETVLLIREDTATANHSLNTGIPISIASRSHRIAKDIRPLTGMVLDVQETRKAETPGSARAASR